MSLSILHETVVMPRVFRYNTATDKHKGRIITRRVLLRSTFALAALVFGSLVVAHSVYAVTSLSQGYLTTGDIPIGSVVALEKNSTDSVAAASTETTDGIIGVAINDGSSLLTLNNGGKASVQVATNGVTPTIVSDCNGKIEPGDQITASPLKGVGMKATANAKVVGTAQGTMTGTDKQKVEGAVCENTEVTLGQVPVLVSISYHYRQPEKTIIPASLQNLANTVAGKKVSTLPVILSSALFIVTIIVVSVIIYSIIRSSIISIGRNPMAQSAVYRNVIQLSTLVLAILGVSVIAIYLILTRL